MEHSVALFGAIKEERWLRMTNRSKATAEVGRGGRDSMEGDFAPDAGQVPAEFVVVAETPQMEHYAVEPG
ncbi:MAG: hypothetical protein DME25_09985 [Verrucomicrobia bacterium]|nr:MAG: hypothetical protein DME25_09985 [Verrucomicrobiota bacterium]